MDGGHGGSEEWGQEGAIDVMNHLWVYGVCVSVYLLFWIEPDWKDTGAGRPQGGTGSGKTHITSNHHPILPR